MERILSRRIFCLSLLPFLLVSCLPFHVEGQKDDKKVFEMRNLPLTNSLVKDMLEQNENDTVRLSFPTANDTKQGHWLVVAGRKVIPGSIYPVVVHVFRNPVGSNGLVLMASLIRDETEVAKEKIALEVGEMNKLLLKVPDASTGGSWTLRIEGRHNQKEMAVFKRTAVLQFSSKFLTVFIQTSRPVYNAGQTVRFRIVFLTSELRPYDEPVDIFVLDPSGRVMRRWPSVQSALGTVNMNFDLPAYPQTGRWTLRSIARVQVEEKTFIVEQYFKPRFEVFVRFPLTVKSTDEYVEGVVVANMTNWRYVRGNCSLLVQYGTIVDGKMPLTFTDIHEEFYELFIGAMPFQLPLQYILSSLGNKENLALKVIASVEDTLESRYQQGWAVSRVVTEKAKVRFLGDQPIFFRPGMPITMHAFASYEDDHPLSLEDLQTSRVTVTVTTTGGSGLPAVFDFDNTSLVESSGVVSITAEVEETVQSLKFDVSFTTVDGLSASDTAVALPQHSPRDKYIQVETSTLDATPGNFITLHVRINFFANYIYYIVVSKGVIVVASKELVTDINIPTILTFSIPASTEMAPVARILAWAVSPEFQVVSHSLAVPVNPLGRHQVGIRWNEHKDHTGGSIEMKMLGEIGSVFAISAVWEETHLMDTGHEFSEASLIDQMIGMKGFGSEGSSLKPHIRRASTRSRDGHGTDVRLFATSISGPDTPSTFNFTDTLILTDADIFYHPQHASDGFRCAENESLCLTAGCYRPEERCDGVFQCSDRSDESGCPLDLDPLLNLRLHRLSRILRFYDPEWGDWAWLDVKRVDSEIRVLPLPKRPQRWVVSMFAVGKELGLGLLKEKIHFDSAGPFLLTVEGPKTARMWEQVGIRVAVFNFHKAMVGVLVTLPESPDYKSILVEEFGDVDNYAPRKLDGDRQHVVWLDPGESRDIHFPICFTRTGTVEVTVFGSTQMMKDSHSLTIEVVPEGVIIGKHISILLDLNNRGISFEFMNIHLDETPLVPYQLDRRYIYSTPAGHISISGDVVGPQFPQIPVSSKDMLGLEMSGAETSAYDFASNLWSLHYLRLTNQITTHITYKVLTAVNVQYAAMARYQDETGAFRNWIDGEPSVWLTAYILRTMWIATFQDWENHIYVDPHIFEDGVRWLLNYQAENGSFVETEHFFHPLDSKIDPGATYRFNGKGYRSIALTSHVVLALHAVIPALQSSVRNRATIAKRKAVSYLEQELETTSDVYDVAVVTLALTKVDAESKEAAFRKLDSMKREVGGKVYWSREPVGFNPVMFEDSQKPFLQPKDDQKWDSHSVETSALALMVYVARQGIGLEQEKIVRFLAVMRELDGGLISTLDSVAALEALVEYSFRARLREITDMYVTLEHSADPNFTQVVHLGNTLDLASIRSFDLQNIWGHINIMGRGSGQALVQLDYSYGVDYEPGLDVPPVPSFDLRVSTNYTGRNHSHLFITSCQRWINTDESETSGIAVVEIHLPSGYYIMQDALMHMVAQKEVRNLRWAERTDSQVKFFFSRLDSEEVCFSYVIERWHPVANHSRHNMARVYDLYQPERFLMIIYELFPLNQLDICEVCGSFQCPYCPFYSGAEGLQSCLCILFLQFALIYTISKFQLNCYNR